jgi:antitoxin component YwqK of YwqJK toxin-antitoxin module
MKFSEYLLEKENKKTYIEKYPDGKVKEKCPLDTNGKLNGILVLYYPDGKIRETVTYVHGNPKGQMKGYDESGKIKWDKIR